MCSEVDPHTIGVEQRVVAVEKEDDIIWHFQVHYVIPSAVGVIASAPCSESI
jgi:hypothetical protein